MNKWLISYTILVSLCSCRQLPYNFKRCDVTKPTFNDCLTRAIPEAIRLLKTPMRKLGLPSMHPLVIPAMSISSGPGVTGFEQNYTEFKTWGFTSMGCSQVKLDLEGKNMTMRCFTPQLRIETEYTFNGSMSVMPIYGNGSGTVILDKVRCFHTYEFEEYLKKGRRHFKVVNSSLDVNPGHVMYHFDNLFDGDQFLGDHINLVMNDNWREVYEGIKPLYEEGFTKVFQAIFNRLLERVAVDDIFINS
ncbi:protein takeout-like [Zophobas morio]|uniref:protein takeout-like n=1 Tax=Zophobas morio TaxID=2755281 RepID=UPI0030838778